MMIRLPLAVALLWSGFGPATAARKRVSRADFVSQISRS